MAARAIVFRKLRKVGKVGVFEKNERPVGVGVLQNYEFGNSATMTVRNILLIENVAIYGTHMFGFLIRVECIANNVVVMFYVCSKSECKKVRILGMPFRCL